MQCTQTIRTQHCASISKGVGIFFKSAATVRSLFGPFVELVKSWNLPDWLVHWGHPANMVSICTCHLCCPPPTLRPPNIIQLFAADSPKVMFLEHVIVNVVFAL